MISVRLNADGGGHKSLAQSIEAIRQVGGDTYRCQHMYGKRPLAPTPSYVGPEPVLEGLVLEEWVLRKIGITGAVSTDSLVGRLTP